MNISCISDRFSFFLECLYSYKKNCFLQNTCACEEHIIPFKTFVYMKNVFALFRMLVHVKMRRRKKAAFQKKTFGSSVPIRVSFSVNVKSYGKCFVCGFMLWNNKEKLHPCLHRHLLLHPHLSLATTYDKHNFIVLALLVSVLMETKAFWWIIFLRCYHVAKTDLNYLHAASNLKSVLS